VTSNHTGTQLLCPLSALFGSNGAFERSFLSFVVAEMSREVVFSSHAPGCETGPASYHRRKNSTDLLNMHRNNVLPA
jgi:hypothetical protein